MRISPTITAESEHILMLALKVHEPLVQISPHARFPPDRKSRNTLLWNADQRHSKVVRATHRDPSQRSFSQSWVPRACKCLCESHFKAASTARVLSFDIMPPQKWQCGILIMKITLKLHYLSLCLNSICPFLLIWRILAEGCWTASHSDESLRFG